MSQPTREQIEEAWVYAQGFPSLMDRLRKRERIKAPLRLHIADLAGSAELDWDKPICPAFVEFEGRFERFDEGGSYWVVRSGHHVVATEWVTKKGGEA